MAKQTARRVPKARYQSPELDVVTFPCEGVLTLSNRVDKNAGEWDPLVAFLTE